MFCFTIREFVLLTLISATGGIIVASEPKNDRPKIVVVGTIEYSWLTKDLPIAPDEAAQLVKERKKRDGSNLVYRHAFVVDKHYAFVVPKHKLGTAVNGYYVDSSNGEVSWMSAATFHEKFGSRYKNGYIPHDELKSIRRQNDGAQ